MAKPNDLTIKKETKVCICCSEEKNSSGSMNKFYRNSNKYIHDSFGVCKECIEKIGKSEDIDEVHRLLRIMDLPFLPSRWEQCTGSDNILITYLSNAKGINNPKALEDGKRIVEMHYSDSPTCNEVKDVSAYVLFNDSQKLENLQKWGIGFSQEECYKMNNSVENNIKITGRDDYSSIKAFERVGRAEVQVDRVYADRNLKQGDRKQAEETLTATLKQAGLSYEQINRGSGDSTLCTDIRDVIENFQPVGEPEERFADVDMIGNYVTRFLTKPLLRAMGKDNSKIIDEYEEIRKEIKIRKNKWGNKSPSENQ